LSTPAPASTNWIPLWNLNGATGLNYRGAYVAATQYADGDIVVYNGIMYACVRPTLNAPVVFPVGSQNNPIAKVYCTSSPSWPNAAWTQIANVWTVEYDTDNIWDGAGKMVIKTPGRYRISVTVICAAAAGGGIRGIQILKNSVAGNVGVIGEASYNGITTTIEQAMPCTVDASLNAGDQLALVIYQNSGGSILLAATPTVFSVERLDAAVPVAVSYPVGTPTYSTTPPASPVDGQIWILPADATNGVNWTFRYNAGSSSVYKWEFIGGASWLGNFSNGAYETIPGSGAFGDCPTITRFLVPRAGDYDAVAMAQFSHPSGNNLFQQALCRGSDFSGSLGAATAMLGPSVGSSHITHTVSDRVLAVPAGSDVRARYNSAAAGGLAANRTLRVWPVRVS